MKSDRGTLEDEVAIVTGAGRNIGAAIARRFAKEGAKIVVADIDADRARTTAEAIIDDGGEALDLTVDVATEKSVKGMIEATEDTFGPVDILVNNAAIREQSEFFDLSVEQFDQVMAVNLRGPFLCTREAAKSMCGSGGGRIVNLSSTSGLVGHPDTVAYATSKSGIRNFTRSAAKALAEDNIRVNTLIPTRSGVYTLTPEQLNEDTVSNESHEAPATTLVGRWGVPEDQASAALFLVSPESEFVNGTELLVDGGLSA